MRSGVAKGDGVRPSGTILGWHHFMILNKKKNNNMFNIIENV